MLKKTLGGDRLGSGQKMQVELRNYNRSTHNKGYLWRSTGSFGTLIPFLCQVATPGDSWDIELDCEVMTHPTAGPVFGSAKIQLDIHLAPIRLYNSLLHNNALNIGRAMETVKLPQIALVNNVVTETGGNIDNTQINPSCLLAYLGIRGIGMSGTEEERLFNATAILAYWDIVKNYYTNKQEEIAAVIHTPRPVAGGAIDTIEINGQTLTLSPTNTQIEMTATSLPDLAIAYSGVAPTLETIMIQTLYNGILPASTLFLFQSDTAGIITAIYKGSRFGTDYALNYRLMDDTDMVNTTPVVQTFLLENLDTARNAILAHQSPTVPFLLNDLNTEPYVYLAPITPAVNPFLLGTQEGLAVKTYQSDKLHNWLNTDWIDEINAASAVSTVGNSFTIDQLNVAQKVWDILNRIAASDGSYYSWIETVYTPPHHRHAETPMYMGGLIKELVFQEVISNSESAGQTGSPTQPLGTLGGRGKLGQKHKGGKIHIKVDEPSYILGLFSATPRIDYSQGNAWDVHLETLNDLHKPAMDQIGFQDLITEDLAWWDTTYTAGNWTTKSAGKQPAWIDYMTEINKTYGNFAIETNEMFMTFNRRYVYNGSTIGDVTTYIDPAKFNFIFAETSLDAQNLWIQIAVDASVRKLMSAKIMPAL